MIFFHGSLFLCHGLNFETGISLTSNNKHT